MRKRTTLTLMTAVGAAALLAAHELPAAWDELMGTRVVRWSELRPSESGGVTVRPYFDAPTSTLLNLGFRATTLAPGATPHPTRPHTRVVESVLIVKEGTLEVQLDRTKQRLEEGSAVFLATNQWHALRNAGREPVTFYELDWTSPGMNGEPDYPERVIRDLGPRRRGP